MIKVETIEENYMNCQSCGSLEELVEITIGLTERQTSKFRLCRKCLIGLNKKIKEITE